ncbi:2-oxo acid dehydrogenase subunit E2 [Conexibacter sp. S30A1]|uniref:2-oxo acid dehydrogenase subunit E2 n=1 Tax=Conexibacter sp. S30A1 TaxID=2937800 RepID=UPI00200C24BF|nr:2-oxo acid dehydrogenase subunit E2 [Conexibacter sp. S30A1]
MTVEPWPQVDFERFGPVERTALSRIRQQISRRLTRNAMLIPHVTHHEQADITELDNLRRSLNESNADAPVKLTLLPFMVVALARALQEFPQFNASLDANELVLRHYYNIGIATETRSGLLVPVLRDVNNKDLYTVAAEIMTLTEAARNRALTPAEMAGGTFTISSLGGIGGTGFTPIINAPEVAVLGVTRAAIWPVWTGSEFAPRLLLPLSLSYDHRVIDGAAAARFSARVAELLSSWLPNDGEAAF